MVSEGSTGSHRRAAGCCCSISWAGACLQSVPFISSGDRSASGAPVHVSSIAPDLGCSIKSLQTQHWYPLLLSPALPPHTDLESCSLTCISLCFHLRQMERLSMEKLYFSFVLCLASCSLTWELEMQIVHSHLKTCFFTSLDTWLRMICYWFSFSRELSVCACSCWWVSNAGFINDLCIRDLCDFFALFDARGSSAFFRLDCRYSLYFTKGFCFPASQWSFFRAFFLCSNNCRAEIVIHHFRSFAGSDGGKYRVNKVWNVFF